MPRGLWSPTSFGKTSWGVLFGAKPLPEPVLAYYQLDSWKQISVEFWIIFIQENAFEYVVCKNGGHFAQGGNKLMPTLAVLAATCYLKKRSQLFALPL